MPMFKETHVKVCGAFIVWDALTAPETNDSGKTKWSLKVVVDPSNPDLQLLNNLAQLTLQNSKWKGVLPNGGKMPVGVASADEFNGLYTGWAVFNAGTYRGLPNVHDEVTGAIMDPMQWNNAAMVYKGQKVDILVNCYEYDNKSKGIAAGLEGLSFIVSANAPRQNFGGGGIDTAGAFVGGAVQQAIAPLQMTAAANGITLEQYLATPGWTEEMLVSQGLALRPQPVAQQPMAPAPMAQQPMAPAPMAQQPMAPAPMAPAPMAQQPMAPAPMAPAPMAPQPMAPAPQQPQQAHNFLPQQ